MKPIRKYSHKKQVRNLESVKYLESISSFDNVITAIETENPKIGKYGSTLKSTIRKLRDKCDSKKSNDFIVAVNDFENTYGCIRKITKNDKTLKSNISHIVGVFRRYVPSLTSLVSNEAMRFSVNSSSLMVGYWSWSMYKVSPKSTKWLEMSSGRGSSITTRRRNDEVNHTTSPSVALAFVVVCAVLVLCSLPIPPESKLWDRTCVCVQK